MITLDTFIISDTHFGDKAALRKYPVRSIAMRDTNFKTFDDFSMARWNEVVGAGDYVLHLGDLFSGSSEILSKLNGKKTLILGNNDIDKCENLDKWKVIKKIKFKLNDKKELKKEMKKRWGERLANPYANALIVEINNMRIMFSHFPVGERKKNDKYAKARDIIDDAYSLAGCEINIHGHIHTRASVQNFCYNASTEKQNFYPRKLRDILKDWANY